jgi:hypothetical protein
MCLNAGMRLIGALTDDEVTAEIDLPATDEERRIKGTTI